MKPVIVSRKPSPKWLNVSARNPASQFSKNPVIPAANESPKPFQSKLIANEFSVCNAVLIEFAIVAPKS